MAKFLLQVYPPLKLGDGKTNRSIEIIADNTSVREALQDILKEMSNDKTFVYKPEDLLIIVQDRVVGWEDVIEDGQVVKLVLMAMGG